MAAEVIGPGGGPAGYTHNLLRGFAAASVTEDLEVIGEDVHQAGRYRGLGETSTTSRLGRLTRRMRDGLPLPVMVAVYQRVRWSTARRDRAKRRSYRRADLIVFQGYQPSIRARWAKRRGKTVLYMPHSPSPIADEIRMLDSARTGHASPARYRYLLRDEERLFATADVVVFASPGAAEQYERAFTAVLQRARRRYVSSGVDEPRPGTTPPATAPDAPVVLFAGRYVGHKGYDLFLRAAEIAADRHVEATFATLGSGPERTSSTVVEDRGWTEDPHSQIRDAAVIVVPNRIAYFDLLPLEAAALGKPLVLTRVGGSVDQLQVLPDSIGAAPDAASIADAVAEALERVADDPAFGHRNADAWSEHFTPTALAERWAQLLRAAAQGG